MKRFNYRRHTCKGSTTVTPSDININVVYRDVIFPSVRLPYMHYDNPSKLAAYRQTERSLDDIPIL